MLAHISDIKLAGSMNIHVPNLKAALVSHFSNRPYIYAYIGSLLTQSLTAKHRSKKVKMIASVHTLMSLLKSEIDEN